MNQKTNRFNQDAFVLPDELPGNVGSALSKDVISSGIRTDSLDVTSYTAGDTSGRPDKGLPEVAEANMPKRISRKYIPLKSNKKSSNDAVFPNEESSVDFTWKSKVYEHDSFMSVKESQTVSTPLTPEKGGPSSEVMGLLRQLGHADTSESNSGITSEITHTINEKPIVVNHSNHNTKNVEFQNYITTEPNEHKSQHVHNPYEFTVNPNMLFSSGKTRNTDLRNSQDLISKNEAQSSKQSSIIKQTPIPNTTDSDNNMQHNSGFSTDAEIYKQVRSALGEGKQDWKRVVQVAQSATSTQATTSTNPTNNSALPSNDSKIEQAIHQVLNEEAVRRVELEHVLTHKFSGELSEMQHSMNKRIQELRETLNNFMMR